MNVFTRAVHFGGGCWGVVAVALFSTEQSVLYGNFDITLAHFSRVSQPTLHVLYSFLHLLGVLDWACNPMLSLIRSLDSGLIHVIRYSPGDEGWRQLGWNLLGLAVIITWTAATSGALVLYVSKTTTGSSPVSVTSGFCYFRHFLFFPLSLVGSTKWSVFHPFNTLNFLGQRTRFSALRPYLFQDFFADLI